MALRVHAVSTLALVGFWLFAGCGDDERGGMDASVSAKDRAVATKRATKELEAFVAARSECSVDADCAVVYIGCPLGCAQVVNRAHAAELEKKAAELIAEVEAATHSGCIYSCVVPAAACIEQVCGAAADFEDGGSTDAGVCVWGVDELLAEVGVVAAEGKNCGDDINSAEVEKVTAGLKCLQAISAGRNGRLQINRCIDCSIPSTYVLTPEGEYFHVRMEADYFGDEWREASVERCADLVDRGEGEIECVDAKSLYECQDALPEQTE